MYFWRGCILLYFFFFKQKTAYEMRISDWSSDVGSSDLAAMTLSRDGTKLVVNARITPTPAFQRNPDLKLDQGILIHRLDKLSTQMYGVDATGLGIALLGDTIAANLFMLGYASQLGLLPVSPEAIERAVEINGVAVPFNKAAFALGRLQAVDPARI